MNPLLTQFVAETREQLVEAGDVLLALERDPSSAELINTLFRLIHTIKGASGLFDFKPLTSVVHAGEDVLSAVREGTLSLTPELTDRVLACLDLVGAWIDAIERRECLPGDAVQVGKKVTEALRDLLPQTESLPAASTASEQSKCDLEWITHLSEASRSDLKARLSTCEGKLVIVRYSPHPGCFFQGEDPAFLVKQVPGLIALSITGPDEPLTAESDPFVCALRFDALSGAPIDELRELFRYVAEQVALTEVGASALQARMNTVAASSTTQAGASPSAIELEVFGEILAQQLESLRVALGSEQVARRSERAAAVVRNSLLALGKTSEVPALDAALARAQSTHSSTPLTQQLKRYIDPLSGAGDASAADTKASAPDDRVATRSTVKVDPARIDDLMDLIGELVVAKNSLAYLSKRAESGLSMAETVRALKDQNGVIHRIVQEMQSSIMRVRLMPVGEAFQRYPRMVRDISRKLGKCVELVLEGEETEADKTVIDALSEPLLHLVRNSLDHGVESVLERAANGKPEKATIRLKASQETDHILIELSDDGAGIDIERVRRKALERALVSEERLAAMSDDEIAQLIFLPGLSTAEQVSDLSGRGVGTDVVRTTVESMGGSVTLTSVRGKGCTTRLRLPMSMAVANVMTIQVAGQHYGVPMQSILETVRVEPTNIRTLRGAEAFMLRNQIVPIVRLEHLLGLSATTQRTESIAVLVVEHDGYPLGIAVDEFEEKMEVILKPLEGVLGNLKTYSGSALMGDGSVLLVLNLKELVAYGRAA